MRKVLILAAVLALCIPAFSCQPAGAGPGAEASAEPSAEASVEPSAEASMEPSEEGSADPSAAAGTDPSDQPNETSMTIKITVGDKEFLADIEDSATGKAFLAKLPMTLEMSELNGNEKYCYGVSLPRADQYFSTIVAGDLMLYSGNCIVLFYGSAGGYSYTRIGRLRSVSGLAAALGKGSVQVEFSPA